MLLTARILCHIPALKWNIDANLQVGVTAMLVASKYEEIWAPEVKDFVYISDEAYSREQILEMEKIMLNTLRFNLTVPTPFSFLSRFLKAAGASKENQVSLLACPHLLDPVALLLFSLLVCEGTVICMCADSPS